MGIHVSHARFFRRLLPSFLVLTVATWCGCDQNDSKVSSELFVAPFTDTGEIRVHADKLDFLSAIRPNDLPSELEDVPTDPFPVGRNWIHDVGASEIDPADDSVSQTDDLLVYEGQSRSLLSANLCPDLAAVGCGKVRLNYNSKGIDILESAQGGVTQGGVISTTVQPITLTSPGTKGWTLTFDSSSKNIIAFREEAPHVGEGGVPVGFRTFGSEGTLNKNFGLGNGLLLSLVISGDEMASELSATSEPIVTRLFELGEIAGDGKDYILVFFSTIRAIHTLVVEEVDDTMIFDLNAADPETTRFSVKLLKGSFKLYPSNPAVPTSFPKAFLTFQEIAETCTGNSDVKVDTFQPILFPSSDAANPRALVFDRTTSSFLTVAAAKAVGVEPPVVLGGAVGIAASPSLVLESLQEGAGGNIVSPPLDMRGSFYTPHENVEDRKILVFEEKSNTLLQYNPNRGAGSSLSIFVHSTDVLLRRDTDGSIGGSTANEPILEFATADIRENRLAFDAGVDELISVSYSSGVVCTVATRESITARTGTALANLSYIVPFSETSIRAFDTESNSVVSIVLGYTAFPEKVKP